MRLEDCLPLNKLQTRYDVPLCVRTLGKSDIVQIQREHPMTMHQMGMTIWNRIVYSTDLDVDPYSMARYVQKNDPKVHLHIGRVIKEQAVQDLVHITVSVEEKINGDNVVCILCLAKTFPNQLILVDIVIQDLNNRFSTPTETRAFGGLNLLPDVIEALKRYAEEHELSNIVLAASHIELVPVFSRYGFVVEDTPAGKLAMECGMGIPMELNIG